MGYYKKELLNCKLVILDIPDNTQPPGKKDLIQGKLSKVLFL